ncbi:MAG: 2'-5' RNA ligase family protein [Bacteroidales bacterium]|jgi:2'-5' RNA ligase|nr:2'-5' RNA ligase family protein [Bacteroidales bacterium]
MRYSIILAFDKKTQTAIANIREILSANGVNDDVYLPYHITIGSVETENLADLMKVIENYSENQKTFKVVLSSVGTFMTPKNVVFYSPTMTVNLQMANKVLIDDLLANGFTNLDKYYLPDQWVPHCTIVTDITDNELQKSFEILKANNLLPFNATIDSVCVIESLKPLREYKTIATFKCQPK